MDAGHVVEYTPAVVEVAESLVEAVVAASSAGVVDVDWSAVEALDIPRGAFVLDSCAAPGGKASQIAVNVAAVVSAAVGVFVDEKYRDAANKTVEALKDLALGIEDGELSSAELNANIEAVNTCIDAWKAVK